MTQNKNVNHHKIIAVEFVNTGMNIFAGNYLFKSGKGINLKC